MKKVNLKTIFLLLIGVFLSSYITGCNNAKSPLLAIPQQVTYDDEVKLAQISQLLASPDIDDKSRMPLLFQRGILYDSLGLRAFAQNDFAQLLNFDIAIPDVYNYLGIYAMQGENYDSAFMLFNTGLELDPDYQFIYINRAIGLYRNDKYESALDDVLAFYNYAPNDPTRVLWVYLVENSLDSNRAKQNLLERYNKMDDKTIWGSDIIAFYLGKISEDRLMINLQQDVTTNKVLAERLCETYFYLGKYYQSKGDNKRAEMLFKYALANNVYNYLEHQQALFEINQLTKK